MLSSINFRNLKFINSKFNCDATILIVSICLKNVYVGNLNTVLSRIYLEERSDQLEDLEIVHRYPQDYLSLSRKRIHLSNFNTAQIRMNTMSSLSSNCRHCTISLTIRFV